VTEISVYSDWQQKNSIKTTDFEHCLYARVHHAVQRKREGVLRRGYSALNRRSFSGVYTLHAFYLTSELDEDDYFSLAKQGSVTLILKFAEALADLVTVIAYAEFLNVIDIDINRNVIYVTPMI